MKKLLTLSIAVVYCICLAVTVVPARPGGQQSGGDHLARFDGGIGVIPRASASGDPNVVRGVNPAGQIWVIRELRAEKNEKNLL